MNLRSLLSLALLALSAAVPAQAQPEGPAEDASARIHPAKKAFPQMVLTQRKTRGEQAIAELGDRLPEVAAWYSKSPDELRSLLRRDRHLRVDHRGRLFVEDELLVPMMGAVATPALQSVNDGVLLPLDQTFLMHSRPGANRTIYLNFKGATLNGTAWNGATAITAQPFDLDGVPGTFSTAELQRIQYIWQRVAEDFAPFDVNVTTQPPAPEALTRSSSTDQVFGTTVLITSSTGVYNCSCGGVAYVGVFDDTGDYYKPALVFYNQLGGGNEKFVAEAISHEAGHNMGLNHDGTATVGYYTGHGSGATGWAPIMGVGYYQALVQWSKGQYSGADNLQDDFTVMAANGLPLRADDHGNTTATATALTGTAAGGTTTFSTQGVIERSGDVDLFKITAAAGVVTVGMSPASRAPNLDAQIDLRNSAGTVLATANPVDALNATLTFTVPAAGTYYVGVTGVGKGDPLTTGYTNYGSLGNYALQVTAATGTGQAPTVALSATPATGTVPLTVALSAAGSTDADGSIVSYEWIFGDGTTGTGVSANHVYSTAGTYTAQVKVTDNAGLSSTRSVTITANPVAATPTMKVAAIDMTLKAVTSTSYRATASVKVTNGSGQPVSGATVKGAWSGLTSRALSATTNTSGVAVFNSASTRNRGTFTFTVTGVTKSGITYNSSLNVETTDSITR